MPTESSELQSADRVSVRFQLRPRERVLFSLLFGRAWRAFAVVGLAMLGLALVPGLGELPLFLVPGGLLCVSAFAWLPFSLQLRAPEASLVASSAGLEIASMGGKSTITWSSIKSVRRSAGALVLRLEGANLTLPMRAFEPGQIEQIERLAAAPSSSARPPEAIGSVLMTVRTELSYLDYLRSVYSPVSLAGTFTLGALIAVVGALAAIVLVPVGLAVATLPLWAPALILTVGGGWKTAFGPYEVQVAQTGYRATGASSDSWSTWASFRSATWKGHVLVLATPVDGKWPLSTRGFSPEQLDILQRVLVDNGLLDPARVRTA
jgi:hypothetical protein